MPQVLKKRKAERSITVNCMFSTGGCGAKLRFKKSEGRYQPDPRDGDAYVFRCSECGKNHWIAASIVDR